jgi:hypothetical protein
VIIRLGGAYGNIGWPQFFRTLAPFYSTVP